MKTFAKTLTAVAIATVALAAAQVQAAVVVSYGGQAATDGSGFTSIYVPDDNQIQTASAFQGYFIETFDTASNMDFLNLAFGKTPLTTSSTNPNITIFQPAGSTTSNAPCGFNSYGIVNVSTSGGGMGIQRGGTTGVAGNPNGDTTCFAYAPGAQSGNSTNSQGATSQNPAQISLDYATLLSNTALIPANSFINYIGFYLGSIDYYNSIYLYNTLGDLVETVSGAQILGTNAPFVGNWTDPRSNVYVNLAISDNLDVTKIVFQSTGVAVELDNFVVGLTTANVPEPESLALVGLGLLGLAATRRRKSA